MRKGFTLVELSIVLVIIGLLIGGILVGQSLVESTKIKNLIKQADQYEILTSVYKEKFRYLPGDDPSAYKKFSGGDWQVCGFDTDSTNDCDGNGNGIIQLSGSKESTRAWQHLRLANILQDGGISESGYGGDAVNPLEENFGNGGGWRFTNYSASPNNFELRSGDCKNAFMVFGFDGHPFAPIPPIIAKAIDTKYDDGLPNDGIIEGKSNGGSCHSGGTYKTSNEVDSSNGCATTICFRHSLK